MSPFNDAYTAQADAAAVDTNENDDAHSDDDSSIEMMANGDDGGKGVLSPSGDFSVSTSSEVDHGNGLSTKQKAAQDERRTLGKRETRVIFWLRAVVILLLFLIGFIASCLVWFVINEGEVQTFETEFGFYADQVVDRFTASIERKLDALDTLSATITSFAQTAGQEFPFVTVDDFEYRGANFRIGGDAVLAFYMPYIAEDMRAEWEAYASLHRNHTLESWLDEEEAKATQDAKYGLVTPELSGFGLDVMQSEQPGNDALVDDNAISFPGDTGQGEMKGPYFPVWQISPALPPFIDMVNLDMSKYDFLKGSLPASVASGEAVFDVTTDLHSNTDGDQSDAAGMDLLIKSGQYRHSTEQYEGDPLSGLVYPVFNELSANERTVVGVVFTTIYWRFLFSNILPKSIQGVVCVLENSFGQQHTYRIDGREGEFVGEGDLHDAKFSHLIVSVDVAQYVKDIASPATRSFTAVDLNNDYLNYTLKVYPSDVFQDIYVTGQGKSNGSGVAIIFSFAIFIFLVYDCVVQRRQRIVLDRAVKATAVVSSLYPAAVREQIINDEGNEGNQASRRKQAFLRNAVDSGLQEQATRQPAPLATKHPDCTVYFADLTNFTKWSSSREPEQVFQLLEAIFKEFDAAAHRRGVFKVETIGDCYMAVCGLESEPDHAVRMARFAYDCMQKLDQVTTELSPTLGEGTDDLALRTGMHSGPVTAGVLRGEKGRFQLFGDTVNSASRMESTGVPRKIQVSQETADALILHGKESWLVPRREKVFAKGKGELQTYFLELRDHSKTEKSSSSGAENTSSTCLAKD